MNTTSESILQALTLDQKLAQLVAQGDPGFLVRDRRFDKERARSAYPHGVGGLMVPIDLTPPRSARGFAICWTPLPSCPPFRPF